VLTIYLVFFDVIPGGVCLYPEILGITTDAIALCIEIDSKFIIGFDGENGEPLDGDGQPCTAKAGEGDAAEECNSCFVCADGGISFDCSNVKESAVATCADIGTDLPTGWLDIFTAGEFKYPAWDP